MIRQRPLRAVTLTTLTAAALVAIAPAALAQGKTPSVPLPYRPGIDVTDYDIMLDLPERGAVIGGRAVLAVRRRYGRPAMSSAAAMSGIERNSSRGSSLVGRKPCLRQNEAACSSMALAMTARPAISCEAVTQRTSACFRRPAPIPEPAQPISTANCPRSRQGRGSGSWPVRIDPATLHTVQVARVGRMEAGLLTEVYRSPRPIVPEPFPRSRSHQAWQEFLRGLHQRWGGRWSAPAR